jgi:hypothetical protein
MLGFNPLSSAPISDLGALAPITGYISTTDSNDTATLNASALQPTGTINATDGTDTAIITAADIVSGNISATDGTDTATINGTVIAGTITGDINATDGNDTANLQGVVTNGGDTHDAITADEYRRAKALDKRIHKAEQKRIAAVKAQAARRRQRFIDSLYPDQKAPDSFYDAANFDEQGNFVAPQILDKAQKAKLKVIKKKILSEADQAAIYEREIEKLRQEQQLLIESIQAKVRLANLQMQLAIIEAQRLAELDDEEALLALL